MKAPIALVHADRTNFAPPLTNKGDSQQSNIDVKIGKIPRKAKKIEKTESRSPHN
jgi:hypothetical protein